jgi:hypothetical protein
MATALVAAAQIHKGETVSNTPSTNAGHQVASVAPPTGLADELLDELAAFRPIEITIVETQMGTSEATIAQVVTIDPSGAPHNRGEIPIFWIVVRDQLRAATPEVPWVAGVLTRSGRAYRLRELTPTELARVTAALDRLTD